METTLADRNNNQEIKVERVLIQTLPVTIWNGKQFAGLTLVAEAIIFRDERVFISGTYCEVYHHCQLCFEDDKWTLVVTQNYDYVNPKQYGMFYISEETAKEILAMRSLLKEGE